MIDPQVAFDKLAGFQVASELADYFKSEGIQGTKAYHDECPIAIWMTKTTGMRTSVADYVIILDSRSQFSANSSPAMIDFMRSFDRGDYPELVKNREVSYNLGGSSVSSYWV